MSALKYPNRTPLRGANDRRESIRDAAAFQSRAETFRTPGAGGRTPRGRRMTMNPNPTNDKKWQQGVIRNLMTVLEQYQYPAQLTPKQLMSPTTREFQQIIQFLFQIIDEDFEFGPKIDEDIIGMLKILRYPFQISKTSLAAPGAPTTWHNLLAVLQFLVELITGISQNEIDELTAYQEYCLETYARYMNGDDEFPELDQSYGVLFEQEYNRRKQMEQELQRTLQHLQEHKQSLENADTLETVQLRIADLERKKQKHEQYANQMNEHLIKKQRALEEKQAESNIVLTEAKRLRTEVEQRQAVLNDQKYSVADVERIREELTHYTNIEQ